MKFNIGDKVKFKRPPPNKQYIITEFVTKRNVVLKGVETPKDFASCNINAIELVEKGVTLERWSKKE